MANETATNNNKPAPLATATATPELREPIIIDLGKKKRKQVRKLRRGRPNNLTERIMEVVAEGIDAKAIPANAQTVVVIVREKKKKAKYGKMWGLG